MPKNKKKTAKVKTKTVKANAPKVAKKGKK